MLTGTASTGVILLREIDPLPDTEINPKDAERLGIQDGETTEDGIFTLNNVACLGCCSLAPVMMVQSADGDETYGNLTKDSVKDILDEIRKNA